MKPWKLTTIISGAVLVGVGAVLAVTNPDQPTYESFATAKLVDYLSKEVCGDAIQTFRINADCEQLLQSNQALLRSLVTRHTQRQNFLFFSIYHTELEVMALLPSYQFETVGGLGLFYMYKSEKK